MATTYNYDGVVIVAIGAIIRSQLVDNFDIDTDDLKIGRSYQPTAQAIGARTGSLPYQIFFTPIVSASMVGNGSTDALNDDEDLERTYSAIRRVTYQVDCLTDYDPDDDDSMEAQDLAQAVNEMIMQLDTIEELIAIDINIEKVTSVRPSFQTTSEGQYESTPSFDITLTYNVEYIKTVDTIQSIEYAGIYGI